MVIDKEKFQENFKHFDNELIAEIIDMFIDEYPERLSKIKQNIEDSDMKNLRFNAHSLKGVIANFMADLPKEHARILEEKSKNEETNGLLDDYQNLEKSSSELIENLKEIRLIYSS
jgi:HPt (histidine-containing phosphotransfer) domain-containing protein